MRIAHGLGIGLIALATGCSGEDMPHGLRQLVTVPELLSSIE